MKKALLLLVLVGFYSMSMNAQMRNGRYGRTAIPQAEAPPKEPEPKTAEEIVAAEMPAIIEAVELNDFEAAVVSSILNKYVQQRIELRILKLEGDQAREAYEKIDREERAELESGLPPEKYEAMIELKENGYNTRKLQKKKKKRKKKKT